MIIGGSYQEYHERLELSEVYYLDEGVLKGQGLKAWHKTPEADD
jgi:hypothetical protein